MKNHEQVKRELLEQSGQVTTLMECFTWLQRCDECIERLEELCCAKLPRLAVRHRQSVVAKITRLADAIGTFVHIGGEYASGDERSLVWQEINAVFENRILTGVVINYISSFWKTRAMLERV